MWKQQVIVENRAGYPYDGVAKSTPDGYTQMLTLTVTPSRPS